LPPKFPVSGRSDQRAEVAVAAGARLGRRHLGVSQREVCEARTAIDIAQSPSGLAGVPLLQIPNLRGRACDEVKLSGWDCRTRSEE